MWAITDDNNNIIVQSSHHRMGGHAGTQLLNVANSYSYKLKYQAITI